MTIFTARRIGATIAAAACATTLAAAPASADRTKPQAQADQDHDRAAPLVQRLPRAPRGHGPHTLEQRTRARPPSAVRSTSPRHVSNPAQAEGPTPPSPWPPVTSIGGSPFLSGLFHDEPSVESINEMGLDVSSVGNHEFDEGTAELLRMQNGGCHPTDRLLLPEEAIPYAGADFQWLAANVVDKDTGKPLPARHVDQDGRRREDRLHRHDARGHAALVSPAGVASVDFLDEVADGERSAPQLKSQGVKSIVVLIHEGGYQTGTSTAATGISGPIAADRRATSTPRST